MRRVAVSVAALLLGFGSPVLVGPARAAEVGCPAATLCLYPGQKFEGQPFLVTPPAAAAGQCVAPPMVFSSAIDNTRFDVFTYSRPDCRIPPTPFAMCCSDRVDSKQRMKLKEQYRSIRWLAH